jgi:hypothetical protein
VPPFVRSSFERGEPVDVAVGLLAPADGRTTDVLDQPHVACRVVLDTFVAAGSECGKSHRHTSGRLPRIVEGQTPDSPIGRLCFGSEEELLGERVPCDPVEVRQRSPAGVSVRHQSHAPGRIRLVEVDAGDVAVGASFVALEQEVMPTEGEVDVLVGLGLERLLGVLGQRATLRGVVAVVRHA